MKIPKINKTILVHLALFTVSLIYGANYTIAKEVMPLYISPSATILMRVLGATLLFWMFVGGKKLVLSNRKEKITLFLSAIFGVVVNQLLFFEGLARTTPINAALIMTTTPLLILVISAITGGEKFTFLKVIGVGLGLLGAAMLISSKTVLGTSGFSFAFDFNLGDLFILLNATSYAIYLVIARPLLKKYSALSISKWLFTLALPFVLPFGFSDLGTTNFAEMPPMIYVGLGYIVLFTTFFAYLLNAWTLRRVSSSVVGIYIYLQPVLATFIAIALDKDSLTPTKLIWAACIFLGVFLVSKK
jgi:drug/metabolite transporter (DMT)-like permease